MEENKINNEEQPQEPEKTRLQQYIEKKQEQFKNYVESGTDRTKKSIIVFCVIVVVVMAVMNMCKVIRPMFSSSEQSKELIEPYDEAMERFQFVNPEKK
jgi:thermostable 8-oxoguanine DNA glycosylase